MGFYLRICLYFKVVVTKMTFHPKLEDGCGVVLAHRRLLGIVPHAHANVRTTPTTPYIVREFESGGGKCRQCYVWGILTHFVNLMIIIPWSSFLALSLRGWEPLNVLIEPYKKHVWDTISISFFSCTNSNLAGIPFWRVVLVRSLPVRLMHRKHTTSAYKDYKMGGSYSPSLLVERMTFDLC